MGGKMDRLRRMFYPESVAVIGASANPQKWGFGILHNLIQGNFAGKIYPININREEILGIRCYKNLADVSGPVDLVVVVVPPENLELAITDCVKKKPGGVVMITAGMGEVDEAGKEKEAEIGKRLQAAGIEGLGPNCQGMMCVQSKLFAQYVWLYSQPGKISLLAQSGNVGSSILGRGIWHGLGFSKFINYGNEAFTPVHELLDYLAEDPDTGVIAIYIEGPKDGRAFFKSLSSAAAKKPVVILKGGINEAGTRAVSSHTGAMAGRNEIFFAAARQAGAVVTPDLDDFYYATVTFSGQPVPQGNKIGIVTWGGGWGVLAADECGRLGLELPKLPEQLAKELGEMLSYRWSRNNPVDLATSGGNRGLIKSLEIVARHPAFDGIIHIGIGMHLGAQKMAEESFYMKQPEQEGLRKLWLEGSKKADEIIARKALEISVELNKPVLVTSDMAAAPGPGNIGWEVLNEAGRIIYPTPNVAARAMSYLVSYRAFLARNKSS